MDLDDLEVIVGTYENLILGFKTIVDGKKIGKLESSFTDDSHRGALRCITVSPNGVLASSSTDDSIRLHSLRKRKEIGGLFEHSGTVNSLQFFPGGHMFSASDDCTICMWKCKNWEVMKTLKGHKSSVTSLAIHPSGKLGLSTGYDKSFLTWDLVTGKLAFQRKLQEVVQNIVFTNNGDNYVLVYNKKIEVCSLADTKVLTEVQTEWRINAICLLEENSLAVGGDSREIIVYDLLTGEKQITLDAGLTESSDFNSRVRALCRIDCGDSRYVFIGTASGIVKGYRLVQTQTSLKADVILTYETGVRLTCMAVFCNSVTANSGGQTEETKTEKRQKKRKKKLEVEAESDDDDQSHTKDGHVDFEDGSDSDSQEARVTSKLSKENKNKGSDKSSQSKKRKLADPAKSSKSDEMKGKPKQGKKRLKKNKRKNK